MASATCLASDSNSALAIFGRLNQADIRYCVLRHDHLSFQAPAHSAEIDLLVAPEDLGRLADLLNSEGFVPLPNWGHAPHHFFCSYDPAHDRWTKLDVVTSLRYGTRSRWLEIPCTSCLQNRRFEFSLWVPSAEDEFLTLLLHCLLDKKAFPAWHRHRLTQLAEQCERDAVTLIRLRGLLQRCLPAALDWDYLSSLIRGSQWDQLLMEHDKVAGHLFRRNPLRSLWQLAGSWLARRLRPLWIAVRRRGPWVALLAPDGAGKSTLATRLAKDEYISARIIYMGMRHVDLPWLDRLEQRLFGEGESAFTRKLPFPLQTLRAFLGLTGQWLRLAAATWHSFRGRVVIFDRYVFDAWLWRSAQNRKKVRRWLRDGYWPTPELTVVLDAPGQVLYARKKEHSAESLEAQRRLYRNVARLNPGKVQIVDATRPSDDVGREVTALIWQHYVHAE